MDFTKLFQQVEIPLPPNQVTEPVRENISFFIRTVNVLRLLVKRATVKKKHLYGESKKVPFILSKLYIRSLYFRTFLRLLFIILLSDSAIFL